MIASLSLPWIQTIAAGTFPYLCPKDVKRLEIFIEKTAEDGNYPTYEDVIQEAKRIKIERNAKAVAVLTKLKHELMAKDLINLACKQPTPQWVTSIETIIDIKTINLTFIEQDRL